MYFNYCEKFTIAKVHKRTVLVEDMFYGCVLGESDHAEFVHQVDRPSIRVQHPESVRVGPPGRLASIPTKNEPNISSRSTFSPFLL